MPFSTHETVSRTVPLGAVEKVISTCWAVFKSGMVWAETTQVFLVFPSGAVMLKTTGVLKSCTVSGRGVMVAPGETW